jgi:hypothetical protein
VSGAYIRVNQVERDGGPRDGQRAVEVVTGDDEEESRVLIEDVATARAVAGDILAVAAWMESEAPTP